MSFISFLSNIKNSLFSTEIDFENISKRENISNFIDPEDKREVNQEFVSQDVTFLTELKGVLNQNPEDILNVLKRYKKGETIDLGFGNKLIRKTTTWGYGGVLSELIFKNDELTAYKIYPVFPDSNKLTNIYIEQFNGIFRIENDHVYYRYYNLDKVEKPIMALLSTSCLNNNLKFLMTPYTGTIYGGMDVVGPKYSKNGPLLGVKNGKLPNRLIFEQEKKNITPEICFILMYSMNITTRLMAIEFYLNNMSAFNNRVEIEKRISEIYNDSPTVTTVGLIGTTHYEEVKNSKELVEKFAKELN